MSANNTNNRNLQLSHLRIRVMTVDIYSAYSGPRRIMSKSSGIVVHKRYNNTGVSGRIHDILHVLWIERLAVSKVGVLILGLVENDRTSVGDLVLCNDTGSFVDIAKNKLGLVMYSCLMMRSLLCSGIKVIRSSSQNATDSLQPSRVSASRSFGIDIRTRTS